MGWAPAALKSHFKHWCLSWYEEYSGCHSNCSCLFTLLYSCVVSVLIWIQWMLLDELFEQERNIRTSMANRSGVLALLLHQTIDHDPMKTFTWKVRCWTFLGELISSYVRLLVYWRLSRRRQWNTEDDCNKITDDAVGSEKSKAM